MTLDELNKIINTVNFSDNNKEALKRVLIDGESQANVAREFDIRRQRMSQLVERVKELYCPPDWEIVTLILPPNLVEKARKLEKDAKKNIN